MAAGRLAPEQFERALKSMMVEHDGRFWIIGARTDKWYVHTGREWLRAEPPGDLFLFRVADVFFLNDRGTIATGRVERGRIGVGEVVALTGFMGSRAVVVTGIEMFSRALQQASAGENVALIMRDLPRQDIEPGMALATPGSVSGPVLFECEARLLAQQFGGRQFPLRTGDRLAVSIRGQDLPCQISLATGASPMAPGEVRKVGIWVILPPALTRGESVFLKEGGRIVGTGIIT